MTHTARLIAPVDQLLPGDLDFLAVFVADIGGVAAVGVVELFRRGVQHIGFLLGIQADLREGAFAGLVVDQHAGLDVIAEHMEHEGVIIAAFDTIGFHLHAPADQVIFPEQEILDLEITALQVITVRFTLRFSTR